MLLVVTLFGVAEEMVYGLVLLVQGQLEGADLVIHLIILLVQVEMVVTELSM